MDSSGTLYRFILENYEKKLSAEQKKHLIEAEKRAKKDRISLADEIFHRMGTIRK